MCSKIADLARLPGLLCLCSAELVLPCGLPCFALPRPPTSFTRESTKGGGRREASWRPGQGKARQTARQDQLSRAKAKQARQPSQISRPKSRPEADPVARPTSVVAPKSPKSTQNLIGHNLTHMAPQKMASTPKDAEFRRGSFWFPPNHPIFRAPGLSFLCAGRRVSTCSRRSNAERS